MRSTKLNPFHSIGLLLLCCVTILVIPEFVAHGQSTPKSVAELVLSGDYKVLGVTYNSGGQTSIVELFDSSTGLLLDTVDLSPSIPRRIALSPNGDRIAHTGPGGDLGIFDVSTGQDETFTSGGAIRVDLLAWNPVNDRIAFELGSGIKILDASTNLLLLNITGGEPVVDLEWSPDGTKLASSHYVEDPFNPGSVNVNVKVWDLSTMPTENILSVPSLVIEDRGGKSLTWSPDGTRLAIIEDQRLLIFNVAINQVEEDLQVQDEKFAAVAWNRLGTQLATGGSVIRFWDTNTWQITKTIVLDESVIRLQWSYDGQRVFSDGGADDLYIDDIPVSEFVLTPTITPSYTSTPTNTPTNTPTSTSSRSS